MIKIQFFWHGAPFGLLEKLTLQSFVNQGYDVNLWAYSKISCDSRVHLCDANQIIPQDELYFYSGKGDCRKGSIGGFSDLFRYTLLYKQGGTYVDMDSVCLSYCNFDSEYVIKPHSFCGVVANVLKAPAGSTFLEKCISETKKYVKLDNDDWILPVNIFANLVKEFNLTEFISPKNFFGSDDINELRAIKTLSYNKAHNILPNYILHWCKEASYGNWSQYDYYNWNKPVPLSVYSTLLINNGVG